MEEAGPRGRSVAFAVVLWVVLTAILLVFAALAITEGIRGSLDPSLFFLLMLWAALTGWIVRQRWPRSLVARLLPETFHGRRTDEPCRRPVLTIALALAGLAAAVAWALLRRK
ncbi:MAG TPA: hypothetical protein VFY93_05575 [Planctomycetota bacterium]|nr:hypothetical protein [Planctomycetota bacterium]